MFTDEELHLCRNLKLNNDDDDNRNIHRMQTIWNQRNDSVTTSITLHKFVMTDNLTAWGRQIASCLNFDNKKATCWVSGTIVFFFTVR